VFLEGIVPWQLQTVRLTAFTPNAPEPGAWQAIAGHPPDDVVHKPRERSFVERGAFNGMMLVAESNPLRSQIELQNINPGDAPLSLLPGSVDDVVRALRGLAPAWLEHTGPTTRLAFGAVALELQADRPAGYRRLAELLPGLRIDPGMSDLLYRINRARQSNVIPDLRLNRVSTWNPIEVQQLDLLTREAAVVDTAVAVQLDINTAAENRTAIPAPLRQDVVAELVALGLEILDRGDVG
jgi:hypothetical protein